MSSLVGTEFLPLSSSPFAVLSPSEQEILELGFEGLPNKTIAIRLGMSLRSAERRRSTALRKLGVATLIEAARLRDASPPPANNLIVAAFRHCAIPLSIVTPDHRYAAANGAYCRALGYSESELVGKTIAEISHPDDRSSSVRTANELFSGAVREFRLKKRYRRRSGEYLMAELNAAVSLSRDGKPLAGVGELKSITS